MLNEHEQHASLECTRARVNKLLEFQLILLLFLLRQFTTKAGLNCKNCGGGEKKGRKLCGRRKSPFVPDVNLHKFHFHFAFQKC